MEPQLEELVLPNTWCDICQVAKFDDAKLGGYEVVSQSGETRVQFDPPDGSRLYPDWTITDSFPKLANLTTSAENGCDFCRFLKELLQSGDVTCLFQDLFEDLVETKDIEVDLYCSYQWGTSKGHQSDHASHHDDIDGLRYFRLTVFIDGAESKFRDTYSDLYCDINCLVEANSEAVPSDGCAAWLGLEKSFLSPSSLNTNTFDQIKSSISECCNHIGHHEDCKQRVETSYLPSRLIEICNNGSTLRLVRRSDIEERSLPDTDIPRYTALSYCWGNGLDVASLFKTTSDTEISRMSGFRLSDLPKVLQDAVTVTNAMSLSFIWIDALCILQDLDSDWEKESSQLVNIYGSAYITICSLTSSCHLSFLEPERPHVNLSFQSSINSKILGGYTLTYLRSDADSIGGESFLDDIPKSRWFSRGWTYPELIMSARLLLFYPPHTAFLCPSQLNIDGRSKQGRHMETLRQIHKGSENLHEAWLDIVAIFTDRVFTFPKDTLPAISGVAKVFAEDLFVGGALDDYVAGIWRSNLVKGLMWSYGLFRAPDSSLGQLLTRLNYPNPYIAPSWSWAGNRYINFYYNSFGAIFQQECYTEITTILDGPNVFGKVKGGELIITGRILNIGPFTPRSTDRLRYRNTDVLMLQEDVKVHGFFDWKVEGDTLQGHFKLILLATCESTDYQKLTTTTSIGLIVHKAQKEGTFHRVGRFDLHSPGQGVHKLFQAASTETVRII